MNFSFELSGTVTTGNISPEALASFSSFFGTFFGIFLSGMFIVLMIICLVIAVFMIISRWRIFEKASLPGWGILIPFYNRYLMFQLGGRSGWNFLWILLPPVFGILMIINYFKIAQKFGKPTIYGLGIRLLKIVFIPILAFDNSKYLGKKTSTPVIKAPVKKIIKKAPVKKTGKKK